MATVSGDEEDLLSLVCLQRYVKPPEYTVLRVHLAQKLGLHLLWNSRARDGTVWSPVLSRNIFTSLSADLSADSLQEPGLIPLREFEILL